MASLYILFVSLFSLAVNIGFTYGYFINIDAHAEECYFDKVTSGTKMSLMFEVAEGGFLDIDVKVGCPRLTDLLALWLVITGYV